MRCPECDGDNPDQPRICEYCGVPLPPPRTETPLGNSKTGYTIDRKIPNELIDRPYKGDPC
jgi:hypothetical protein